MSRGGGSSLICRACNCQPRSEGVNGNQRTLKSQNDRPFINGGGQIEAPTHNEHSAAGDDEVCNDLLVDNLLAVPEKEDNLFQQRSRHMQQCTMRTAARKGAPPA